MKRALEAFWRDLLADLRSVRYAAAALGRNLMAGLRLALFLPVSRLAFRIDAVQLLLLFMLLCLIDIGGDRLRFAGDASFNLLGAGNELAGIALLAAMAVVAAVLFRKPGMTIALLVTALAALPIVQIVYYLPYVIVPDSARAAGAVLVDYGVLAWEVAIMVRVAALQIERPALQRWWRAGVGGLLLALPLAVSPWLVDDVPWYRSDNGQVAEGSLSPAAEPVLAAQKDLLDDALSAIDDRVPENVNLYFVVYAPDGDEAAWNQHAETVRTLVDDRLETKGRSIVLRNHTDTMLTTPFATVSNLRETFGEIAAAADPDQDILMLYIGGKGARNGAIPGSLPPLDLVALTPVGLKSLLDDAGFQWRIIIVAACYAGAYADALQDERTAVLAASASDRPSFGCEGRGDPTFFGDALFSDGFARTDSLAAAFAVASDRVTAREHERGLSASQPQMRVGREIEPMLRHLRRFGSGATAALGSSPRYALARRHPAPDDRTPWMPANLARHAPVAFDARVKP
jgi:hypothetical protein